MKYELFSLLQLYHQKHPDKIDNITFKEFQNLFPELTKELSVPISPSSCQNLTSVSLNKADCHGQSYSACIW